MIIYGAGLAGLLAGNMLRSFKPIIREAKRQLPNNHSALLRFRTDKVGSACAVKFKQVGVTKAIRYGNELVTEPSPFYSNMYSQKVTGAVVDRSITNLDPGERYIAPEDLISKMAQNCSISYDKELTLDIIEEQRDWHKGQPLISTIPMPVLMKIVGWENIPEFRKQKIYTVRGRIESPDCEIYQTIYYPSQIIKQYRTSVIGDIIISEFTEEPDAGAGGHIMGVLYDDFGIRAHRLVDLQISSQEYGKILPIDNALRKNFIFEMTSRYNIYSVGRFATWRQLLLDDVVDDIQQVEKFISSKSDYGRMVHNEKGTNQ
jgi:hypothetical protein|tara:strand:+ start:147 stop:1097 length:951 start_codon:yes stop_codon:yes gene_type:complete